ncbi:unnamed protein product, partial [Onchocerca ochengi]|uniref:ATP-dependent DNA helicase n=1 Tax=Onchocerca ochengi TaxID=42157 RepID=A0A182EVU0_ONCOC
MVTYRSFDTVVEADEAVNYPTEFLNSIDLPGMPPRVLQLKIGVPIIMLQNMNQLKLCNGTRLARLQFPVRLAFVFTINKAQGLSLELCGLDLETDCFSHGQLYVACSRVGKPDSLYIYTENGTTKNIVYPQ